LNYLAHLYLADDDPESLIGSLLGDFARGRIDDALPAAVRWGVVMHRRIDAYTDAHAVFRRSKRRIRPEFRRYAGILVDVYYDHFLASRWADYSGVPLEAFASEVYRTLQQHRHSFPPPMQRSMAYMVGNQLLQSYRSIDGIRRSLQGIEGRLKRPSRLRDAVADLEQNYQALGHDFEAFFPDLVAYVARQEGPGDDAPL
jgi:acyl carrier protein phosphodiesterase